MGCGEHRLVSDLLCRRDPEAKEMCDQLHKQQVNVAPFVVLHVCDRHQTARCVIYSNDDMAPYIHIYIFECQEYIYVV